MTSFISTLPSAPISRGKEMFHSHSRIMRFCNTSGYRRASHRLLLKQDRTGIVFIVDEMHSRTRHLDACKRCLMGLDAIHPCSAERRYQRRVDIYYPVGILTDRPWPDKRDNPRALSVPLRILRRHEVPQDPLVPSGVILCVYNNRPEVVVGCSGKRIGPGRGRKYQRYLNILEYTDFGVIYNCP